MIVYIVYDVWILFELCIVFFFFKETRGMSLEETAAIFDGQDAVQDIAARGNAAVVESSVEEVDSKERLGGDSVMPVVEKS